MRGSCWLKVGSAMVAFGGSCDGGGALIGAVVPGEACASGGAGIGLTICRALVHAHGGTITASSAGIGQGTSVRFSVPRADAP